MSRTGTVPEARPWPQEAPGPSPSTPPPASSTHHLSVAGISRALAKHARREAYPEAVEQAHADHAALHAGELPGPRAEPEDELQAFFDHADDEVSRVRGRGRKGWLPAFRDAMLFKTAYAYGLRRNDTRMLDVADFGRNPEGPEFGEYGVCYIRHGKAKKGSPPKRRSVLTVWEWSAEILDQWMSEVRLSAH